MLKLTVNTKELETVLKKLEVIIPNKPKLEILAGIKLVATSEGVLKLTSSDLENTIVSTLDVNVDNEGELVLTGMKDIMKSIKFFTEWQTKLEQIKNDLVIRNGDKKILVPILDIKEFPNVIDPLKGKSYNYKENKLYERIMKVNYARGKDNTRPFTTGIHLNKNHLVALDGYRMALSKDDNLYINEPVTISNSTINALRKTLNRRKENNMNIILDDKHITFIYNDISLTSNLLECDYFKYEEVLPESPEIIKFDRKELEDNLKFLYIHSKGTDHNLIDIEVKNKIAKFKCTTQDSIISTDIEIDSNLKINQSVNNKYLIDALKVIKEDKVNYKFTSNLNPLCLVDSDSLHLILVIRRNENE